MTINCWKWIKFVDLKQRTDKIFIKQSIMKDSIIILCGGGPAPGMNTVVFSVAKTFLNNGFRVIGLHGGYSGLFNSNPRIEDIDFFKADS